MNDYFKITKNYEFERIYKKGKSFTNEFLVVFYKKNFRNNNRISFVASKKVGNAVNRNRARRLMREAIRNIENDIKGYDFIFVARKGISECKMEEIKKSIEKILKKIGR